MKIPKTLPDAITRRHLLYGADTPPELLKAYGGLYEQAGRLLDALEFYHRSGHSDGIETLRNAARDGGDAFLLDRIQVLTGATLDPQIWQAAAESARSKGWYAFARVAFGRAGMESEAQAIEQEQASSNAETGATAG